MQLTEFSPVAEVVTAALNSEMEDGSSFGGPISIGYYPGTTECWIDNGGHRFQIQAKDMAAFCKQLKRAVELAKDQS